MIQYVFEAVVRCYTSAPCWVAATCNRSERAAPRIGSGVGCAVLARGKRTPQPHHSYSAVPSAEDNTALKASVRSLAEVSVGCRLVFGSSFVRWERTKRHQLDSRVWAQTGSAEKAWMRIDGGIVVEGTETELAARGERQIGVPTMLDGCTEYLREDSAREVQSRSG